MCAFHGEYIARILHDAEKLVIPVTILADAARRCVGDITANQAFLEFGLDVLHRDGKVVDIGGWHAHHIESQTGGRFRANAWQLHELFN